MEERPAQAISKNLTADYADDADNNYSKKSHFDSLTHQRYQRHQR
jgi:hypothetical protein